MVFKAEIGRSEQGKHPLLLYRSTTNTDLCFKFSCKRTNKDSHGYACVGCQEAYNNRNEITINTVRVSEDYSKFLSDPELLDHPCLELNYTFRYTNSVVQQEVR
jgi:hypothetical protein